MVFSSKSLPKILPKIPYFPPFPSFKKTLKIFPKSHFSPKIPRIFPKSPNPLPKSPAPPKKSHFYLFSPQNTPQISQRIPFFSPTITRFSPGFFSPRSLPLPPRARGRGGALVGRPPLGVPLVPRGPPPAAGGADGAAAGEGRPRHLPGAPERDPEKGVRAHPQLPGKGQGESYIWAEKRRFREKKGSF